MCEKINSSHMYTPCEWTCSNEMKYADAVAARQSAQNQDHTCDVILNEIKNRTERAMADVDKELGTSFKKYIFALTLEFRLDDITFWMNELTRMIKENADESDALGSSIIRLKKDLEATKEPLYLAKQCMHIR